MNRGAITVRYAKALYQVGEEKSQLKSLKEGIDLLLSSFKESPELTILLDSPVIKTSEKKKIFSSVFKGNIDEIIINFFNLLADNKREAYLKDMCLYFSELYKKNQGIKEAVITTALPLDDTHKQEILSVLENKLKRKLELTSMVNPSLIGGFKLRIDDQQVDASIAAKLRRIQNELIEN